MGLGEVKWHPPPEFLTLKEEIDWPKSILLLLLVVLFSFSHNFSFVFLSHSGVKDIIFKGFSSLEETEVSTCALISPTKHTCLVWSLSLVYIFRKSQTIFSHPCFPGLSRCNRNRTSNRIRGELVGLPLGIASNTTAESKCHSRAIWPCHQKCTCMLVINFSFLSVSGGGKMAEARQVLSWSCPCRPVTGHRNSSLQSGLSVTQSCLCWCLFLALTENSRTFPVSSGNFQWAPISML